MTRSGLAGRLLRRNSLITLVVLILAGAGIFGMVGRGSAPDLPTVEVTQGEFVDTLELRGEIRPLKSVVLSSPMQSGELQILKLAKNGSPVKAGDVVVEFDGTTLQRTIQEKQSELKQANAEIEQARSQSRITDEQNATSLMKAEVRRRARQARYRARGTRCPESRPNRPSSPSLTPSSGSRSSKRRSSRTARAPRRICPASSANVRKRSSTWRRAEDGLKRLQVKAPTEGVVNILPNYRSGSMFGGQQEFRQGDRAWAGAAILELPDFSSVHLLARLDESDRGRLKAGLDASVRIEAVPGREFKARIDGISMLARPTTRPRGRRLGTLTSNLVLIDVDPRDPAGHDRRRAYRHRARPERRPGSVGGSVPAKRIAGRLQAHGQSVRRDTGFR